MNRGPWRTEVLRLADAVGSPRWDATAAGEVDAYCAQALDREWRRVLKVQQFYRLAVRTPTSDAQGRYLLSDLSTATERLFRILKLQVEDVEYEDVCEEADKHYLAWKLGGTVGTTRRRFFILGDYVYTLPIQLLKIASAILVNHIPKRFDQLTDDDTAVTFPDGFERIPQLEAAADLLMKGAEETAASLELRELAKVPRLEMMGTLARYTTKPTQIQYSDSPLDWGVEV